jgi:hypothetical protein
MPSLPPCAICGRRVHSQAHRYCSHACHALGFEQRAVDRFWSRVDKTGECWRWQGFIAPDGYGQFSHRGRTVQAHRVAWEFHHGRPIPEGMMVCHDCPGGDHRWCVRPDHLFLGTHADNTADAVQKQRFPSGSAHPRRAASPETRLHLKHEAVREIRLALTSGRRRVDLAVEYGVSIWTIHRIAQGRAWPRLK